jgi:hypothetical protein
LICKDSVKKLLDKSFVFKPNVKPVSSVPVLLKRFCKPSEARMRKCLWILFILILSFSTSLSAQKISGEIRGVVTDPSGALASGATVTAIDTATNLQRSTQTSSSGVYVIPNLGAGNYQVKVKQKGFKEAVINNVTVNVSSTATVNAALTMGSATESVTVEAAALQVQTDSAVVGEVVDGAQTRELPLNGRSFVQLTQLQPGVSAANSFDSKNKGLLSGVDFAVNGNPTTNNLFLIDGANNNDVGSNRTILIYPSIDSIAEFKMLRNSYGPEYGQASGSVISIVTRGGGNQFHGGVNYFGRNDAVNATEFYAARAQSAVVAQGGTLPNNGKDKLRRNDYSYNIGGPIKKDKLFFFWSEEWNKEIRGNTRSACVPTAAERSGDFTKGVSCGAPMPSATLVPGGKILSPDPAGSLIAQLLPLPNVVPSVGTGGKNWFSSQASNVYWREENARIDYNVTKKNLFTFRYTQDTWKNPAPNAQGFWGDDPFPAVEGNWDQPSKSLVAKLTSTLTDSMVNEAQFSYSNNRINTSAGGTNPGLVGQIDAAMPTIYPAAGKLAGGLPTIWGGLAPYGDGQNLWLISPFANSMDLYTVRDDISKTRGNHSFKAGVYFSSNSKNETQYGGQDRPAFGAADWAVANGTGNALANILLPGQVFNGVGEQSVNPTDLGRWHDFEFYFGDTWKARRNLTIEYGARWSFLREPYDDNNQMSSWNIAFYDKTKPASDVCNGLVVVPGTDPCGDANKLTGSTFSHGTQGVNRALVANNNHNIAPRLGISWDPWGNGKTAVRAGVGQFFQRERVSPQVGLASNSPFSISTSVNRTLGVAPALVGGGAVSSPSIGHDPRPNTPNSWQWNLTVEREFAKDTSFQVGYVGNKGLHLTNTYDINQVLPANRLLASFQSTPNSFRPAPNFGSINFFGRDGWSTYHSLQTMFRTRINTWARIQASYTWSHSISNAGLDNSSGGSSVDSYSDLSNKALDKGNSSINRPHIFVTNAIFNLPSFKGSNGFMKETLGGWEFTTIATLESGNSLTVYASGASDKNGGSLASLSGTGFTQNQRPNLTGSSCSAHVNGGRPEQILNPAAFTLVGFKIGSFGNASRGSCSGPGLANADLALYKNWAVKEKLHVQFRLELFNALNSANFRGDKINTDILSGGSVACGTTACTPTNNTITAFTPNPNFGLNTGPTRGAREIQYALKLTF